jgi:hypothetical protein
MQSGLVDLWCRVSGEERGKKLLEIWALGAAANALVVADHFRREVGQPDAELVVEVEIAQIIKVAGLNLHTGVYGGAFSQSMDYVGLSIGFPFDDSAGTIEGLPLILPRLPIRSRREFVDAINTIATDLHDAAGSGLADDRLELDFGWSTA